MVDIDLKDRILKDRILTDMKVAMKNKNQAVLQALKLVYAEYKNKAIDIQAELDDTQLVALLKKQVKQYEESIDLYEKAGRLEQVKEQKERLNCIKSYLPKSLGEEELKTLVHKVVTDMKATSIKEMGSVIKAVQSQTAGAADNSRLAELVKERLQNI